MNTYNIESMYARYSIWGRHKSNTFEFFIDHHFVIYNHDMIILQFTEDYKWWIVSLNETYDYLITDIGPFDSSDICLIHAILISD